jgi:hypothetical protein
MSSHGTQNGCLALHVAPGLQPSPFKGEFRKKWHTSRRRQGLMDILKPPLTGLYRNIVRSEKVTTMSPISKEVTTKRAGLTFYTGLSRKIFNIMAKHDIKMAPKVSGTFSRSRVS